ncbi:CKLF-like MARVEL transmembrane domain-containing protein 4 [Acanthaster planci]|uniref:CKLF-like MARVEL transmembrane domain-containing protein 4 n=1 Tax=Acanthaster planci TaxID=133434 RepID=A0A8B7YMI9_ACAPL|nr:CKLF-like MARVEL transmembrane domain-containing protein 4 [Acanthaster planci]
MADRKQIVLPTISSLTYVPTGLKYLTLPEGILELIEVVCLVVAFVCVTAAPNKAVDESSYWHYQAATMGFCLVTCLIMAGYMTGLIHKIKIPWSVLEIVYCAVAGLLLLTTGAHIAANVHGNAVLIVATVFGFIAAAAYVVQIFFAIRAWKRSIIAATLKMVEAERAQHAGTSDNSV